MPDPTNPDVLFSGDFWTGFAQTPTPTPIVVTFSFPTSLPTQDSFVPVTPGSTTNLFTSSTAGSFTAFTAAEQAEAIKALSEWATASQIVFVQVAPGQGDINFSNINFKTLSTYNPAVTDDAGIGFNPFGNWNINSKPYFTSDLSYSGNIFMNNEAGYTNADGTVAYDTLLHEIGHAIGLKHPNQVDQDASTGIDEDNTAANDPSLTIMATVGDFPGTGAIISTPGMGNDLRQLDMEAAAAIYGSPGSGTPGTSTGSGEVISDSVTGGVTTFTTTTWDATTETPVQTPTVAGTISGSNSVSSWTWDPSTQTMTQTGTDAATDVIHGTSVNDVIYAGSGTDSLFGLDGDNTLIGGSLTTSSSVDSFYGGPDQDTMTGGAGTNTFYSGGGTETMTGGPGTNTFWGGAGSDTMNGASGTNDTFNAGSGTEVMTGGSGTNTFYGGAGSDTMNGGSGTNTFVAGTGTTIMNGGSGTNSFYDGGGADRMVGDGAHDYFTVTTANTTVIEDNSAGFSSVYSSINYTLPANVSQLVLEGPGLTGTAHSGDRNVSLYGYGSGASTLIANSGADNLVGGSGNDTLVAGSGGDSMFGNGGANTFVFNSLADTNAYIGDFVAGIDKIDLSGIASTLGHALDFVGSFTGNPSFQANDPGQVEAVVDGTTTYLEVDATTGTSADFSIDLYDPGTLHAGDLDLNPSCYCAGTRIMTEGGEVAVETLKLGDRVITLDGSARPIKWIGQRAYAGRYADGNRSILPVCFKPGSLAAGLPRRDLWVSPDHAMFLEGVLIPAAALVNGQSIVQAETCDEIRYFHIELDSHAVILAEGAWAESFLDDDSRMLFHNAQDYFRRYPGEAGPARFCAPRVEHGWELEVVRQRLAARATAHHGLALVQPAARMRRDGTQDQRYAHR